MERDEESIPPQPLAHLVRGVRPLREDDDIAEAAARIGEAGGGLPVCDGTGRLVGYLSERDVLEAIFPAYLQQLHNTEFLTRDFSSLLRKVRDAADDPVREHMTREPVSIEADDSESHAAELFLHAGVRSLPVVGPDGRVVGVLRLADMVRSLLRAAGA